MKRLLKFNTQVALAAISACLWFVGCSKEAEVKLPQPKPKPPTPVQAAPPTDASAPPPAAPTEPPPPAAAATPAAAPAEGGGPPPPFKYEAVDALTDLARQYRNEKGRSPATVEDLVTGGMTTKLPTPPPGKHFVIDSTTDKNDVRVILK